MKRIANLYIALLALYYSQGAFYSEGSWLSRILLVIILIVSIYYFIFSIQHYSLPKPLKIMSFLLVVFTIYGLIPMVVGVGNITRDIAPFQYIKMIFLSQLPIYAFYVFWKERWIDESVIRRWFFVFLVVAIGGFYYSNSQALANALLL